MQRRFDQTVRADCARLIAQKFSAGRLLVFGRDAAQNPQPWLRENGQVIICRRVAELDALPRNGATQKFDTAVWFSPATDSQVEETEVLDRLTNLTDDLVLVLGAETNKRRAQFVERLAGMGFLPDYESNIIEINPAALELRRVEAVSAQRLIVAAEAGFARMHAHMFGLQRTLRTRLSELEAADRHIAQLEEKLLKLKQAKRDVTQLKAEKQALRKSPERKIGQIILAPYRLPQKLVREVRKRWPQKWRARASDSPNEYQKWFAKHAVTPEQVAEMRAEARRFGAQPLISVIMPVFDTPVSWLHQAIASVREQAYENWELILIDDASTNGETCASLEQFESRDPRFRLVRLTMRSGISAASNAGLEQARGEWIGLLDHDDLLEPDALFQNVKLIQEHPAADLIYSDEDKITESGLDAPLFKPDWSPDFFLANNYLQHFTVMRKSLVRELGGFRSQYDFAQDYDLFLRVTEQTDRIYHIPRILYHWRRSAGSTSTNIRSKPDALEAARGCLNEHLRRVDEPGHVAIDWRNHGFRIRRHLVEEKRVAIIIPTRDRIDLLARCVASVEAKTIYGNYEIVVVDNESESEEAQAYFQNFPHRVLRYSGPFNYSAINNLAVEKIDAPWILFLNNDTEVIEGEWLTAMAEHVQRAEVGAVGARLIFRDETVQHAGVVLGVRGVAGHAFRGFPAEDPGVCRQLQVTRNYSAVTAACLLTRREVFQEVGGFDEVNLPVIFNDVDLCLKMRRAGYLIVYTPFAKLYHDESATRRTSVEPSEAKVLLERWPEVVARDPYYNPNLSREKADFSLGA